MTFEAAVLYEHSIGDPSKWGADYRGFARAKAALAWRGERDTHWIQEHAPHLLQEGDSLLWGSVCRSGLIVAASGAHPWYDEAFSGIVWSLLVAVSQDRARAARLNSLYLRSS